MAGGSTVFVKYSLAFIIVMSSNTELTDTAYDILKVLGKDADFLYDTIETYIKDAQKANKTELVKIWQTIKEDRKRHMHLLKEALEKEIHS
jgi:rubrerythrin